MFSSSIPEIPLSYVKRPQQSAETLIVHFLADFIDENESTRSASNMSSSVKIRIKIGDVEVDYEGEEKYLRDDLRDLIVSLVELRSNKLPPNTNDEQPLPPSDENKGNGTSFSGTTATVAAKLSVKSGTELLLAAAVRMAVVLNKQTYTRAELHKEMQSATAYYKKNYGSNLSSSFKTLIGDDKLREVSKDVFALSAAEIQKNKGLLAS